MIIKFYRFSKRNNSTSIVNGNGQEMTCQLKAETDMINPTLLIQSINAGYAPTSWNYCYIPAFARFYFIVDWVWINGIWECTTTVDVLATYKTQIGALDQYVIRSASAYNGRIVDSVYPTQCRPAVYPQLLDNVYARALSGGFYIVGIIGSDDTATQGAITYYQMTDAQFARLREYLLSNTFLSDQGLVNLSDFIPADATKVIYNPYQYIASCQWFPFDLSAISSSYKTSVSVIKFGWWNVGTTFSCYRINPNCPAYEVTIRRAWMTHPVYTSPEYEYMSYSPYSARYLRFAPFGDIQIPDDYFVSGDFIIIKLMVDMITGIGFLEVWSAEPDGDEYYRLKALICRESQQISIDIQLAQIGKDYYGANAIAQKAASATTNAVAKVGKNLVSGISNAVSGNYAGVGINLIDIITEPSKHSAEMASLVNDYVKTSAPQLMSGGTNGSLAAYYLNNYIINIFYRIVDQDATHLGYPLYERRVINTLSGYIQVQNPDIDIPCLESETIMIMKYMSSGFFYE